jgi:hypothetical protein
LGEEGARLNHATAFMNITSSAGSPSVFFTFRRILNEREFSGEGRMWAKDGLPHTVGALVLSAFAQVLRALDSLRPSARYGPT